ncbi:hypothetical protein BH20CHL6_BH20CHL6_07270 [soil metagenome]
MKRRAPAAELIRPLPPLPATPRLRARPRSHPPRVRWLLPLGTVLAAVVGGVLLVHAGAPLSLGQSYPGHTISYYMDTTNPTRLYELGCGLGEQLEHGAPPQDALVIMAFGQALKSGSEYGASAYGGSGGFGSTREIAEAVQQYARGFYLCSGANYDSHVKVVVGTSTYGIGRNLGSLEAARHGAAWAGMVNSINAWLRDRGYRSQAGVVGGNDIEVSWSTPGMARAWVDGYDAAASWPYYNFGDAAGCPTSGTTGSPRPCGGQWTQEDVWYVAYGVPSAYAVPEIYRNDGALARQWQQISLYGYLRTGWRVVYRGSLTQYGACQQRSCDPSLDNTPRQGWMHLHEALAADPRTELIELRFASDIRWF